MTTDQITHNKENFITLYKIKLMNVKFPNNSCVIAFFTRIIQFSEKLIIFNVLYILKFSLNLISIQTLIKDCKIIFPTECC